MADLEVFLCERTFFGLLPVLWRIIVTFAAVYFQKNRMQSVIEIQNGVPRHPQYRMKEPVNFILGKEEHLAIVGPNGGGKSLLVDIIIGKWPLLMNEVKYHFSSSSTLVYENIKYMAFRDSYGDSDCNYYYQQRWNSQDMEVTPLVRDLLPQAHDEGMKKTLYGLFGVEDMLDKHVVLLSSGELRKFQLVKALLGNPQVLILDNPFIGLDAGTRSLLQDLLSRLIQVTRLQVVLVLSKTDDIPSFITHVVQVENRVCGAKMTLQDYHRLGMIVHKGVLSAEKVQRILDLPYKEEYIESEQIVQLNKVCIRYGERTILKDLDWTVNNGEKWALTGDNGAGKSTLLSLVCADNPQSYACDIALFGKKRGSGESIWEIKKHIGYVSPEMHRAYSKGLPAIDIVASGLHDSVGLYKRPRPEQMAICEWWMDILGIAGLKERNFLQLSSGEQRLVLLARAFVKDPELLILDEPLHGLDMQNRCLVKEVIDAFCQRKGKTLIMVSHYQEEFPSCITHSLHLKR